jgi:RNA polymerase sigma-70 factor (ECF subfamily)
MMTTNEEEALAAAARTGDQPAFAALAERHRSELQLHCYRMVGSLHDSQDLVQETFLKAWRGRATFQGRSTLRAWLYGIATHGCLDFLAARRERVASTESEVPWLEPYPDRLLPEAAVISRETIELAFLVAIQLLPPKQRAALILCDVLEWSAKEAAELLDLSVPSVNSALQRARATLREHQPAPPETAPDDRELVARYVAATESCDLKALAELLRDDVRFSMRPDTGVYSGRDRVVSSWVEGGLGAPPYDHFRCVVTRANGLAAVACYVRNQGEKEYHPHSIDVVRIEDGRVAEIYGFHLPALVEAFDLPPAL